MQQYRPINNLTSKFRPSLSLLIIKRELFLRPSMNWKKIGSRKFSDQRGLFPIPRWIQVGFLSTHVYSISLTD